MRAASSRYPASRRRRTSRRTAALPSRSRRRSSRQRRAPVHTSARARPQWPRSAEARGAGGDREAAARATMPARRAVPARAAARKARRAPIRRGASCAPPSSGFSRRLRPARTRQSRSFHDCATRSELDVAQTIAPLQPHTVDQNTSRDNCGYPQRAIARRLRRAVSLALGHTRRVWARPSARSRSPGEIFRACSDATRRVACRALRCAALRCGGRGGCSHRDARR